MQTPNICPNCGMTTATYLWGEGNIPPVCSCPRPTSDGTELMTRLCPHCNQQEMCCTCNSFNRFNPEKPNLSGEKSNSMQDKLNEIDNILAGFEDMMHGEDGDLCTEARGLIIAIESELKFKKYTSQQMEEGMREAFVAGVTMGDEYFTFDKWMKLRDK